MQLGRSSLLLAVLVSSALAAAVAPGAALASTYRVRPGDTLSGIAAAHRLTVAALARLNRLDPNGILLAGAVLQLPVPHPKRTRYRVRAGDTLSAIAARRGTSVGVIARLNRIDPDAILPVGRILLLPRPASSGRQAIRRSIVHWARHYGVRPRLALGLAWQESGYQPNLTSSAGAWGVMQVMPATWKYAETILIGRTVPHTTDGGIRVGVAYLHHLLHVFGDERLAVAAYLQGEFSLRRNGVLASSEAYIADVLALAA